GGVRGGDDGVGRCGCRLMMLAVVVAVETVAARGVGDRVDRETSNLFGFAGKVFWRRRGGGGWWPAGGESTNHGFVRYPLTSNAGGLDHVNPVIRLPIEHGISSGNNMVGFARNLHVFVGGHQFLIDFIILENINEFVEKGLTEVLFGQPFKEHVGINDDRVNGVLWFKIRDDKTIFNMPHA
nr:homeodomain-like protein [Tanacetum cinerariifolium]